jgi:hypothetical protein
MCDEREQLIGYLYNECSAEERRQVEEHLEQCAVCREEIAGLRHVREDLLAWEVPDHGSVWQPFAPIQATPWWRQVPAWAMAAAASAMFIVGAAGSVVTHALVTYATPAETRATVMPVATGFSAADLEEAESRLLSAMRSEIGVQVGLATAHVPPQVEPATDLALFEERMLRQMRSILAANEQQQVAWVTGTNASLTGATKRMDRLERDMEYVLATLQLQGR